MRSDLLHWTRSEEVGSIWHLSFDGYSTVCGMHGMQWGGPPMRPHTRALGEGPPDTPLICVPCKRAIAIQLGLQPPDDQWPAAVPVRRGPHPFQPGGLLSTTCAYPDCLQAPAAHIHDMTGRPMPL
jgi:hypothetical protein